MLRTDHGRAGNEASAGIGRQVRIDHFDSRGRFRTDSLLYDESGNVARSWTIGLAGGLNLYGFAGGDPVNFADPFGLQPCDKEKEICPSIIDQVNRAMADAFANLATKTLEITAGVIDAFTGLGDLYTAGGLNPAKQDAGARLTAGGFFLGGLIDPSPGLAKGIKKAVKAAQGEVVTFRQLDRFLIGTWEVAGDKGAGAVRWNRVLDAEGSTIRLYKDVYNQGGNWLRRDWYVGGPPR